MTNKEIEQLTLENLGLKLIHNSGGVYITPVSEKNNHQTIWLGSCIDMEGKQVDFFNKVTV